MYLRLTSAYDFSSSNNLIEYDEKLSDDAKEEVRKLTDLINQLYDLSMEVYETGNRQSFVKAMKIEDKVDDLTARMAENHIARLGKNLCSAEAGAQFLKLASDVERIGDHLININDKNYEVSH